MEASSATGPSSKEKDPASGQRQPGPEITHSEGYDMKKLYGTDIRLGERYRDDQTGIEGTATVISFHQHGCERVNIEVVRDGKIEEYAFDAPRLTHIGSGKTATTKRTGGPDRGVSARRPGAVTR